MKVFVFSTHNTFIPHIATELELIQNHIDKNDEVYRFICKGSFPVCDINTNHDFDVCNKCHDIGKCSSNLFDKKIIELPILKSGFEVKIEIINRLENYNSIEDIKKFKVENFDVGYAVLSSIISWLRDPYFDVNVHKEIIDNYIKSSVELYYSTLKYIEELKPDLIYVFNGRLAHVKGILRASQSLGVNCKIHERGHDLFHYELYNNTTPHDIQYIEKEIKSAWDNADINSRKTIGEKFFQERVAGKVQNWISFISDQKKGLLPANWDKSKRNIIIFNSSEDEFASIGPEWSNTIYTNQLDGIKKILEDSIDKIDIHFYLRIHPNLKDVKNKDIESVYELSYPNLTIVPADSPVSSYALLYNCEKVITFGSTMGVEATFWQKPSILAGISFYKELNATYNPKNHTELMELVDQILEPKDKVYSIIYGYYYKTFGVKFNYYIPESVYNGKFKGINLSESRTYFSKIYYRLRNFYIFLKIFIKYENWFKKRREKLIW